MNKLQQPQKQLFFLQNILVYTYNKWYNKELKKVVKISSNIFGAVVAFLIGTLIALANYSLSKHMLKKKPQFFATTHVLRQVLVVAYLVVIYCFGGYTPYNITWLLVGGCLGVTLPTFYFTFKLVKINDKKEDDTNG